MYNGKFVSAVICAAGSSSRMKTDKSKQLITLGGMTVLERSVRAFADCTAVDEIVVVCPENARGEFSELLQSASVGVPLKLVTGGAERQDSVKNGVDSCDERSLIVAVHDGARPFVTNDIIIEAIEKCDEYGCAAPAVPVKDTIKRAKNGLVTDTPPRDELFAVQTPQVFMRSLYLEAFESAADKGIVCTDDCRLFELYGSPVFLTKGDYSNIKITTPEDIPAAQAILSGMGIKNNE